MFTVALLPLFGVPSCSAGLTDIAMDLFNTATENMGLFQKRKLHFDHSSHFDSCSKNFKYFDKVFTNMDLDDPNEYFYISDDSELIITKMESSWVMHQVIDNELLMFGLAQGAEGNNCPDSVQWYWSHTLDPVYVEKEPLCILEKVFLNYIDYKSVHNINIKIEEPESIENFILNSFENGIIFNFFESENIELNILLPLNLPIRNCYQTTSSVSIRYTVL